MSDATPALNVKQISVVAATTPPLKAKVAPPKSRVGFLLMDWSLSAISFNNEAVQILGYPDRCESLSASGLLLTQEIRSKLITMPTPGESVFVNEFRSGRRRYFCRAFFVESHGGSPSAGNIAVLLERGPSGLVSLSQVCQQFNLTQREQEVLEYLVQGMSSKGIASRMNVSPNTVKAFLRLIMIKTGTSSRSEILGKVMMTQNITVPQV